MRCFVLLGALIGLSACGDWVDHDPKINPAKLLPDSTPYIASLLDHSPDTTLVPLEVWVGTMTHRPSSPQNLYDPYHDPEAMEAVRHIRGVPLFSHVLNTAYYNQFTPRAEPGATVSVTGPLGGGEQTVTFPHREGGVYAAPDGALALRPGARYRLSVRLPGGEEYAAETTMPHPAPGQLDASYRVPVKIHVDRQAGVNIEINDHDQLADRYSFPVGAGAVGRITAYNFPRQYTREMLLVKDHEPINYENTSPWMREGIYGLTGVSKGRADIVDQRWLFAADEVHSRLYRRICRYLRLTDVNQDYLDNIRPEHFQFTSVFDSTDAVKLRLGMHASARSRRDTTYFFRITNVRPTEGTTRRAAGVFGASASRYLRTINVVQRSWDPYTWNWRKGVAPELDCE